MKNPQPHKGTEFSETVENILIIFEYKFTDNELVLRVTPQPIFDEYGSDTKYLFLLKTNKKTGKHKAKLSYHIKKLKAKLFTEHLVGETANFLESVTKKAQEISNSIMQRGAYY